LSAKWLLKALKIAASDFCSGWGHPEFRQQIAGGQLREPLGIVFVCFGTGLTDQLQLISVGNFDLTGILV